MAALIYIRVTNKPVHPEHIRTPLILPLIFMVICAALVIVTIVQEIDTAAVGLGFLVAGFFFYVIFLWDKALPRYDGYRNACRKINGWFPEIDSNGYDPLDKAAAYNQIVFNGVVDYEDIKESAEAEIEIETKRRETVVSLTKRIVPLSAESEFEIKKQRF
ncbi:Aat-6 [Aphelenchoides besseyi]|nr:Aat-6 [Aphelenchoides besseyi]